MDPAQKIYREIFNIWRYTKHVEVKMGELQEPLIYKETCSEVCFGMYIRHKRSTTRK